MPGSLAEQPATQPVLALGEPREDQAMRSILLWAIGIPLPIILLLAFCTHHL
jgi:hypothetical protein